MIEEPREPSSEHPTGQEAMDQPTQEAPALAFPPPAPPEASSGPAGPPAPPPDLWSAPASSPASAPAPELDKAPRVEPGPAPADSASGGGFDTERVISVARDLKEKPEVLLGAAFGGGILLAIIIRRLAS